MNTIEKYTVRQASNLLQKGKALSTTTYTAAVYYMRKDGTIWMSHPSYNDRKFFNTLKEFRESYRDSNFYTQKRQYNPRHCAKYILEVSSYGNRKTSFWDTPKYGTKIRKEVLKEIKNQ